MSESGVFLRRFGVLLISVGALGACRPAETSDPVQGTDSATATTTTGAGGGGMGGVGGAGGEGGTTPGGLSVLTWNLEAFPLTNDAEQKAAELLRDMAPDVVAVQEISEPSAFDGLLARLDGYDGVLNDDPGAFLRVGLLWRTDRVVVSDIETLFSSDWYAFPRPPLSAHMTVADNRNIDFTVVVLHLKAQLNAESQARREDACNKLDAWVRQEQSTGTEQDFMLIGDLNDKVTDPPQWNVFGAFLDRPETYRFLTRPAADAGEHTYIPFESFIDHVIITSDMLDEIGDGTTEVLPLEQEVVDYRDLTDHRPVRSTFEWSE